MWWLVKKDPRPLATMGKALESRIQGRALDHSDGRLRFFFFELSTGEGVTDVDNWSGGEAEATGGSMVRGGGGSS